MLSAMSPSRHVDRICDTFSHVWSTHTLPLDQVLRAEAPALGRSVSGVALKVTDLPATVHDGSALLDVFSEVALLQSFAASPSVCQVRVQPQLFSRSSARRRPPHPASPIHAYLCTGYGLHACGRPVSFHLSAAIHEQSNT